MVIAMSRLLGRLSLIGLALALVVVEESVASAQKGRRPMRSYRGATAEPTVSPYLNLLRPGDPAFNYFTLVQPQVAFQRNMQQQSRDIAGLGRQLQQDEREGPFGGITELRPTGGRAASFQNYSHYYPSMGGGAGGGGGASRKYPSTVSRGGGGIGMGGMGMGGMGMGF